ncbi:uncharacterized protein LOC108844869 [Raphanus sativus]|uniref:Uncharacterized protein LOC108844869 n=2 Tax=Raphanus sativus TaxID=3726 RepID=A0A9W3CV60_RAPSA|nr:uncharacterized protein LOC108844869 [Raphanus sativus]
MDLRAHISPRPGSSLNSDRLLKVDIQYDGVENQQHFSPAFNIGSSQQTRIPAVLRLSDANEAGPSNVLVNTAKPPTSKAAGKRKVTKTTPKTPARRNNKAVLPGIKLKTTMVVAILLVTPLREVARIFGPLHLLFLSDYELELSRAGKPLYNSSSTGTDSVDLKVLESVTNLIDTEVTFKGASSFVSFIYGAPAVENRSAFWTKLSQVGLGRDSPWLLSGDFNEILDNSEKVGGPLRWEGSFTAFRSFVSQNGLWDLKHSGNKLSWRGNRYSHFIRSRLDRSLVNCSWSELFPIGRSSYLRFEGFDHRPLITYFGKSLPKRRGVFRFNRRSIIKWAKEQNEKSNVIIAKAQKELETALSSAVPDPHLIDTLTTTLSSAYKEEEQFWLQRSRIQWLKEGDRNTGFFHAITRQRRLINSFSVIENKHGNEVHDEAQIATVSLLSTFRRSSPPQARMTSLHFSEDVCRDIKQFFISDTLHPQQNETHIRLIPKITGPRSVSDYRPIALCSTHYKIIAKILSKRLRPLLPNLISTSQSAFVAGRAIGDNVLITHETLHFLRTSEAKKRCAMAVKTDMSKAYDRLEWGFIEANLSHMGFAERWINWVMSCIKTVSYSFLINGSPQGIVIPSRGIRQGDPLSPYIFILCTQVLSSLCDHAMEDGSLSGVRVSRHSPASNPATVSTLAAILTQYETLSGQKINFAKSTITFSARTPPEVKIEKRDIFASIVDRVRQKAFSWTSRFLSGAGKQVLLKAVLAAMPCYAMSCFKIPLSLCKQIQSVLTRFWWDANPEKRKMCWVAWDTLILPKHAGGLGFRDIETFNDALLEKIGWRLLKDPTSLVARVLLGKYAWNSSFMDCKSPAVASHGWRSILVGRELLRKGLGWIVGN